MRAVRASKTSQLNSYRRRPNDLVFIRPKNTYGQTAAFKEIHDFLSVDLLYVISSSHLISLSQSVFV